MRRKIFSTVLAILLLILINGCTREEAINAEPFSFIYMGDSQADPDTGDYSGWGELLALAAADESKPELLLLGGDMVNDGSSQREWDDFFAAGAENLKNLELYTTVGNHDNTRLYEEIFRRPGFYSFDKGEVHFVVLDSNTMGAASEQDVEWLRNDLSQTSQSYKIAMFHHPAYTAIDNPKDEIRANTIRENFIPIMEEYGVQLVLTGHHHVYMRTHPMRDNHICPNGIVYITGVSGAKQYQPAYRDYAAFSLGDEPVYTIVTVNEEGIAVKTYDSSGILVDESFLSRKNREVKLSGDQENMEIRLVSEADGKEIKYSLKDLARLEEIGWEHAYSSVNNWPSPVVCSAKGFRLRKVLEAAGLYENMKTVTVCSYDGYEMSFTKAQLFEKSRWYFPRFEESSTEGAEPVEAILAYAHKDGTTVVRDAEPGKLRLIFGQSHVDEHTNPAFVDDVSKIIVSFEEAESWAMPGTFPKEGSIALRETVKLQHPFIGLVKLHYTIDGSEPTELSTMYNTSTYQPELNKPIIIKGDTVIKAYATGYGKNDSPVAVFRFTATD